jgi:hypothetical protein
MKLITRASRRMITAAAFASAAVLLPAVALASSAGSGQAAAAKPHSVTLARANARPHCAQRRLTAWIGIPGSGAAGSIYYPLEISNISHRTCTLYGFPGVSALGANGRQLGSAAGRIRGYPELTVTLRPGQTAHAVLQIAEVGNFPRAACRPATAYTLRVYAPGDLASMRIPFSFRACRRSGPVYLHVSTTISGTGIPGYGN